MGMLARQKLLNTERSRVSSLDTVVKRLFHCLFVSMAIMIVAVKPDFASAKSVVLPINIPAQYYPPTQPLSPAVILLHGCGGLYTRQGTLGVRFKRMTSLLQEMGFGVLIPDSFSSRKIKGKCNKKTKNSSKEHNRRVKDTLNALRWLKRQPNVDPLRIGILGWSHGSDAALALLHHDRSDIKAAVLFYPACKNFLHYRPHFRVSAPTLLFIGENDTWTPASDCKKLSAMSGQDLFHIAIYSGAYHDFDAPAKEQSIHQDVSNHARRHPNTNLIAPDPEATIDAYIRTFKWFSRWFDPERGIKGRPPSSNQSN